MIDLLAFPIYNLMHGYILLTIVCKGNNHQLFISIIFIYTCL